MDVTTATSLPDQTTKNKKNEDFYRATYDYYISIALGMNDKTFVKECLDAANGIVNEDTIAYVVSPIAVDDEEKGSIKVNIPGTIRNFDFINPIKEKNLGEYIELPYTLNIKVNNPDVSFIRDTKLKRKLDNMIQTAFVQYVNQQQAAEQAQQDPSQPKAAPAEAPDIDGFRKKFIEDYVDDRAIQAKHLLNLINETNNFDVQRLSAFYYWWATEEFYTIRFPMNNVLYKETISPLEGFPVYNDSEFVEDYDAFVIRREITIDQFYEKARIHELKEKDIEYVKSTRLMTDGTISIPATLMMDRKIENMPKYDAGIVDIPISVPATTNSIYEYTIFFPTFIDKKYRIFVNELGQTREEIVDDDYTLNVNEGDIEIKTESIPEVYVGFRYGGQYSGLYVPPVRFPVQRYDENTKHLKLPVGGKLGILKDIRRNPIPRRLTPYMIMDKVYNFQIERLLRQFKPQLTAMPKSILNSDSAGTVVEKYKMMYADNTIIYDDTIVDMNVVTQGLRVIGMQDGAQYLTALMTLLHNNEERANRVANMNDARMGVAPGTDAVTNVQQNIYRAKVGSLPMITMFNKALELDHQADLECAKSIYIEPFTISYFDKNGNEVTHDYDPLSFYDSQLGVFVRNSRVEEAIMQEYRKYALAMAQNDNPELASSAISAESVAEIKRDLKTFIDAKRAYEQSIQQQELALKQAAIDREVQKTADTIAGENYRKELDVQGAIEVAYVNKSGQTLDEPNVTTDIIAQRKITLAEQKANDEKVNKAELLNLAKEKLVIAKQKAKNN